MSAKATILLAAYKGGAYIGGQIESILSQDTDDWQLIVSDDGDGTEEELEKYAKAYPDKITHYRSGQRFGSAQKHFLHLLQTFRDEPYLMFCDQDDVWHTDKVRRTLEFMEEQEKAAGGPEVPVLVHTDLRVVDGELQEMNPSFMAYSRLQGDRLAFRELLVQNVVTGCTVMINRALAALMPEETDIPEMRMHDWWLALAAAAFGRAAFLPEATMDYRQHGGNVVGAKNPRSAAYVVSRIRGGAVKSALKETAAQAAAFLRKYGDRLNAEQKELLSVYAGVPEKGKLARLRIYRRCRLWKADPRRKLGQILWW